MPETYTIKCDLTWAEYFRLTVYMMYRTKIIRTIIVLPALLVLASALLGSLVPGTHNPASFRPLLDVFTVLVSTCGILVLLALLLTAFISVTRPELIRGYIYRFSAAGMERIGPDGRRVAIPWSEIDHLRESRSCYWIYMRSNKPADLHLIQKRMFADRELAEEFRNYVERHLSL